MVILVDNTATIIWMIKGIVIIRVNNPKIKRRPPTISRHPTKFAENSGKGIPIFVNRPTPWLAKTNLIIPSQRNTPPTIKRISIIALEPFTGGPVNHFIIFSIILP
jgi:hypothetical protein